MESALSEVNPENDLYFERTVDVPVEMIWQAWTESEHVMKWFTPDPWQTIDCRIDLRPGGLFYTLMRSPDGEEYQNYGCYLEIIANRRLIWTDALEAGFRPSKRPFMTIILTLEPAGIGTRYMVSALHKDEVARRRHEEMGFQEGWGKALDQLVDHVKNVMMKH